MISIERCGVELFDKRYNDEIAASAYRASTRLLGGESIVSVIDSLFRLGWYSHEVTRIIVLAKAICSRKAVS